MGRFLRADPSHGVPQPVVGKMYQMETTETLGSVYAPSAEGHTDERAIDGLSSQSKESWVLAGE